MRRSDRQITDLQQMEDIIKRCKVCRIAMADGDRPYVVPLNFGYKLENGIVTLYIHCAADGKKIDILRRNPNVCFEMDVEDGHVMDGDVACSCTYRYASIIGYGEMTELTGRAEKEAGLDALLLHITGKTHLTYDDTVLDKTRVYKLVSRSFTCKQRR